MNLFNFLTNSFLYNKYRQNFILKFLSINYFNYFFLINGINDKNTFFFFFSSYYSLKNKLFYIKNVFNFLFLLKKKISFLLFKPNSQQTLSLNFSDINFYKFFSATNHDFIFLVFKFFFFFFRIKSILKLIIFIYLFIYLIYLKFGLNFYLDFFLLVPIIL